jgi:hypothetical protein
MWATTWRAKRKSPLTAENSEIIALPMCNGQRSVKSSQRVTISMTSRIPSRVDIIEVKERSKTMTVSKEPNHCLGGYSHRERWSRTRQKRKEFFYAGHDDTKKTKSKYFWVYTRIFFDYSLGGYSHRERWSRTRQNYSYQIMEQALEHVIDYLVKRWTSNVAIRWVTPIGMDLRLTEDKQPEDFGYWNSQTRLTAKIMILELHHHDKTWMPWL